MNKNKRKDIIGFIVSIGILVILNFIGSYAFFRLDLTSENRYSISEPTKTLLNQLEDQVYVQVYLEGDFPASFKRLRNETREMLDEFQAYADGQLDFEFINPSSNPEIKERDRIYKNLYEQGLRPTDLEIKDDDGISKKSSLAWSNYQLSRRSSCRTTLKKPVWGATRSCSQSID